MSLQYIHTAVIARPDSYSGATDDFGQPTEATTETTVYSGSCDFQDISAHILRSKSGDQSLKDDMDLFFPDGLFPASIAIDDRVSATISGAARLGRVVSVDYLEESVVVRWQS